MDENVLFHSKQGVLFSPFWVNFLVPALLYAGLLGLGVVYDHVRFRMPLREIIALSLAIPLFGWWTITLRGRQDLIHKRYWLFIPIGTKTHRINNDTHYIAVAGERAIPKSGVSHVFHTVYLAERGRERYAITLTGTYPTEEEAEHAARSIAAEFDLDMKAMSVALWKRRRSKPTVNDEPERKLP